MPECYRTKAESNTESGERFGLRANHWPGIVVPNHFVW